MWLHPVVFVLLSCFRHSSRTSLQLIALHKLDTTGSANVLEPDVAVYLVGCVGFVDFSR